MRVRAYRDGMSDTGGRTDHHGETPEASDDVEHSEAPMDQLSDHPQAGPEQNAPLPDPGPTDGVHGTDQDPSLEE